MLRIFLKKIIDHSLLVLILVSLFLFSSELEARGSRSRRRRLPKKNIIALRLMSFVEYTEFSKIKLFSAREILLEYRPRRHYSFGIFSYKESYQAETIEKGVATKAKTELTGKGADFSYGYLRGGIGLYDLKVNTGQSTLYLTKAPGLHAGIFYPVGPSFLRHIQFLISTVYRAIKFTGPRVAGGSYELTSLYIGGEVALYF